MQSAKDYTNKLIQKVAGKTIVSLRMLEDHEDFEFIFSDSSELRVFGKYMLPSFLDRKETNNEVI